MDQKLNENPEKVTATVHTLKPTPMSLNGLTLQTQQFIYHSVIVPPRKSHKSEDILPLG